MMYVFFRFSAFGQEKVLVLIEIFIETGELIRLVMVEDTVIAALIGSESS